MLKGSKIDFSILGKNRQYVLPSHLQSCKILIQNFLLSTFTKVFSAIDQKVYGLDVECKMFRGISGTPTK